MPVLRSRTGRERSGQWVSGFTIVEMMVVTAIAGIVVGIMAVSFSRTRNDLTTTAPSIVGAIRQAQNLALSGSQHEGTYRCGFGILFREVDYIIYAGPEVSDCSGDTFTYPGVGSHVQGPVPLPDSLTFVDRADIYFVPPLPETYLNGDRETTQSLTVQLVVTGEGCPSPDCREFIVDRSGRIATP